MTRNRRKTLILLAAFLLAAALAVAFRRAGRGADGTATPPPPPRRAPAPARPAPAASTKARTVEISGLGPLPYAKELKSMDFSDVFIRCGFARPRMRRHWEKGDPRPRADVYLNDKGEIVHISFQKGPYKTKSRAAEAIHNLEHRAPNNSGGLPIVRFGVPGLTLENTEMLKYFLRRTHIRCIADSNADTLELEITPVVVEVTAEGANHPDYIGRRLPAVLEKRSRGRRAPGWTPRYDDYDPEDLVARRWSIHTLPPPRNPDDGSSPPSAGYTYYEPLLEAWEHHERNKPDPKPPPRPRRENHPLRR